MTLEASQFRDRLREPFRVHVNEAEPLELELFEVRELPQHDSTETFRPPFSVLFVGPAETALQQGTFRVENDTLGALDLFLVTLGPGSDGRMLHEAVFG